MPAHVRDIWPIENARSTVGSELRSILSTANAVDIATAYITTNGLHTILPSLRKASYSGPVRIITGIKDNFTEPAALRSLLAVSRDRGEAFVVKVSRNPHFHWKSYFTINGTSATIIIGSSNLTGNGLGASGELNLALTVPVSTTTFHALHQPFEKEWSRAAVRDVEWVRLYESFRRKYPPTKQPVRQSLKLLGMKQPKRLPVPDEVRHGILYCEGYFSRATAKVLEETTNWDEQGWDTLSVGPAVERGQKMVFFNFNARYAYLANVVDTETTRRTPDGRYFAALEQLPQTRRRRITQGLRRELRTQTLIDTWGDVKVQKFIRPNKWQRLAALFSK